MVNVGPLAAEIGLGVWGTPAIKFQPLSEVNQTLHDVWPSPGLMHCIYTFGGFCPLTEFYQVQNSLCVEVLRSPTLSALLHGT